MDWDSLLSEGPPNFKLLQEITDALYTSTDQARISKANEILSRFWKNPEIPIHLYDFLNSPCSYHVKVQAINEFIDFSRAQWSSLDPQTSQQFKNLLIEQLSLNLGIADSRHNVSVLINKINQAIIEIAKFDWPGKWQNLIDTLIGMCNVSSICCANSLEIISLLCQEMASFSHDTLNTSRLNEMESSISSEFEKISPILNKIFQEVEEQNVIHSGLHLFSSLVPILSPDILFASDPLTPIFKRFFGYPSNVIDILSIIGKMAFCNLHNNSFDEAVPNIFTALCVALRSIFVNGYDFSSSDPILTAFSDSMSSFLKEYFLSLEYNASDAYQESIKWLYEISLHGSKENLALITPFWDNLIGFVHNQITENPSNLHLPDFYNELINNLRHLIILRMPRSCSSISLELEYEDGHLIFKKNDDSEENYNEMSSLATTISYLNPEDMIAVILERAVQILQQIQENLQNSEIEIKVNAEGVGSLVMTAGAISYTLSVEQQYRIISDITYPFLSILEQLENSMDRAIISMGILYISSQYTLLLNSQQELLHTIVKKLLDFMSLDIPGLQESSIAALKSITSRCAENLSVPKDGVSFLDCLLMPNNFNKFMTGLSAENAIEMIEIYCCLVKAAPEELRQEYGKKLMDTPVDQFLDLVKNASSECSQSIAFFLDVHYAFVSLISSIYCIYYPTVIPAIIQLFNKLTYLNDENDVFELKMKLGKLLNAIITYTLKLDSIKNQILEAFTDYFAPAFSKNTFFVSTIIDFFASLVSRLPSDIFSLMELFMGSIIQPILNFVAMTSPSSLEMYTTYEANIGIIGSDSTIAMDKSIIGLFKQIIVFQPSFIESVDGALANIVEALRRLSLHPSPRISDPAIISLNQLITQIESKTSTNFYENFLKEYGNPLTIHLFSLLADPDHKSDFSSISLLLQRLFKTVITNSGLDTILTNLIKIFHSSPNILYSVLKDLLEASASSLSFRNCLRNSMINLKQYYRYDPSLYKEELEQILKEIQDEKEKRGIKAKNEENAKSESIANLANIVRKFHLYPN